MVRSERTFLTVWRVRPRRVIKKGTAAGLYTARAIFNRIRREMPRAKTNPQTLRVRRRRRRRECVCVCLLRARNKNRTRAPRILYTSEIEPSVVYNIRLRNVYIYIYRRLGMSKRARGAIYYAILEIRGRGRPKGPVKCP